MIWCWDLNIICLHSHFRVNCHCSMMTAPTSAQGAPFSPALGSTPLLIPMKQFIRLLKSAPITAVQHRRQSTGAQMWLCKENIQHLHLQLWEISMASKLSRTPSRRHTVGICCKNIPSALLRRSLSLPRHWNQKGVHTCQSIAFTEHHKENMSRIKNLQNGSRRPTMKGIDQLPHGNFCERFKKGFILKSDLILFCVAQITWTTTKNWTSHLR